MYGVNVPDGQVTIREAREVTVAGRRAVQVAVARVGAARIRQVLAAESLDTDGLAAEIGLTAVEEERLEVVWSAVTWAVLAGWTLPEPFPASPAAVGALPPDLRAAVADAAAGEAARLLAVEVGVAWPE